MRWDDVYINSSAVFLGRKEDTQVAVAEGRYDAEEAKEDEYAYIRVADAGDNPADMAITAANVALSRSSVDPTEFGLLLHASTSYQGIDHWTPTSYILDRTVGGNAPSLEIRQACNGWMAGLDLAAAHLSAGLPGSAVLLTCSDKFTLPGFDRYRSDKGMIRGDGATGTVLSRVSGMARIRSTAHSGDASHEGLYRGDGFTEMSGAAGWPVNLRERVKQYVMKGVASVEEIVKVVTVRLQETLRTALADADVANRDIKWFVFPNAGRGLSNWEFRSAVFDIDESRTTSAWGLTVGHIGAGDQIAGFTHLVETGAVEPGDKVALLGIGGGVNVACAVVEVLDVPQWSLTTD
jgi:3-oxoacyl-[acyl-carrier-protein] synthase-3